MKRNRIQQGKNEVAGKFLLLTAATCGALAVGSLSGAGPAAASCASFNGTAHVGQGCTTTNKGDVAIGIGRGTVVTASGGHNTAIAIGNPGPNAYESGGVIPATAFANEGTGNKAFAIGNGTLAGAAGDSNTGIAIGSGSLSSATGSPYGGVQNRTLAIGPHNIAIADGGTPGTNDIGNNTAVVFGKSSTAQVNYTNVGVKNTVAVAVGKGKFVNK